MINRLENFLEGDSKFCPSISYRSVWFTSKLGKNNTTSVGSIQFLYAAYSTILVSFFYAQVHFSWTFIQGFSILPLSLPMIIRKAMMLYEDFLGQIWQLSSPVLVRIFSFSTSFFDVAAVFRDASFFPRIQAYSSGIFKTMTSLVRMLMTKKPELYMLKQETHCVKILVF